MQETQEKKWILSGLILVGFALSVTAFFVEIPAGGADNYAHFNISRWAFRYPHLFLDHWGKPVFTILTAPVAQIGFIGIRILNIIAGLLTAWYSYKILNLFQLKYAWFSIVAVIFTPIYFVLISSGMTEILFGFFLVGSIYLFFKNKFLASAVVISLLFLVRAEGVIFLPLFFVALLFKKQYKILPFLISGFLIFSLIGWIYYYHEFWWIITKRPYITGTATVYGSGTWDHFFVEMPDYFGYIISFLLFAGTIVLLISWVKEKFSFRKNTFFQILLILGCFWGYFLAHVYLWWQTENSGGLVRVMAGVSPLVGLLGVFALNSGRIFMRFNKLIKWIPAVVSIVLIVNASLYYSRSVTRDLSAEVLIRASDWLKHSGSLNYKLVMHNPYFAFSTGTDAWNNQRVQYGFMNTANPESGLPDSTLFIWDAQFSANEGKMPLNEMMNNPNFELIESFDPENTFKVMGNNDYRILVFRKITKTGKNNFEELRRLKKEAFEKGIYFGENYDFQLAFPDESKEVNRLNNEKDSSNWVYSLSGAEFSPEFVIQEEKFEKNIKNRIRILLDICSLDSIGKNRLFIVCSAEKDFKSIHYEALDITEQINELGVWGETEFIFKVPVKFPENGIIKLYIWNIDKKNVLIDNFRFDISRQTN